jgi:hypothetical protein
MLFDVTYLGKSNNKPYVEEYLLKLNKQDTCLWEKTKAAICLLWGNIKQNLKNQQRDINKARELKKLLETNK